MDRIYTFKDLENIQSFMTSLKRKANQLGISLQIDSNKYVEISEKIKCGGYFSEKIGRIPGILAAATGKPINTWLPILVHESCHMDQWYEKIPIWKELEKHDTIIIDEWLEGKRKVKSKLFKAIDVTRDMELDCEKRAVKKILKFNLPIDIGEYIQKANCYIFFYNYLKITRRWSQPENSPYSNNKIYKNALKDWYSDYNEIPPDLLKAFKKYKI